MSLMSTETNFIENTFLEPENYTYVSAQTLENAFPQKPTVGRVEYPVESAPKRTPEERGTLKKSLFFKQK